MLICVGGVVPLGAVEADIEYTDSGEDVQNGDVEAGADEEGDVEAGADQDGDVDAGADQGGDVDAGAGDTGAEPDTTLNNPLQGNAQTIPGFLELLINNIILPIGSVVVVIMIIYSGFLFVKARGNEQELQTARTSFTWTVVGAAVLLGAWAISQAIFETLCNITGGTPGLGC